MTGLKVEKRSICDTTKPLRIATKLSLLKQDFTADTVHKVIESINELDSFFLGDTNSKIFVANTFVDKGVFYVIYSVNDIYRCIYINTKGYVIFRAVSGWSIGMNSFTNSIKLHRGKFLASGNILSVKINDYLEVITK